MRAWTEVEYDMDNLVKAQVPVVTNCRRLIGGWIVMMCRYRGLLEEATAGSGDACKGGFVPL